MENSKAVQARHADVFVRIFLLSWLFFLAYRRGVHVYGLIFRLFL